MKSSPSLGGGAGSTCRDVGGDAPCRTLEVDGARHETIPEALRVRAGLIAASRLPVPHFSVHLTC